MFACDRGTGANAERFSPFGKSALFLFTGRPVAVTGDASRTTLNVVRFQGGTESKSGRCGAGAHNTH